MQGIMNGMSYQLLEDEETWVEHNLIDYSPYEAAQVFPEAAPIVKRHIKIQKQFINKLVERRRRCHELFSNEHEFWVYSTFYVEMPLKKALDRIEWFEKFLYFLRAQKSIGNGKDLALNIEKAKQVPITHFLKFSKTGFSQCIFGHEDKTPSMKYYPKTNRFKCFSCGKGGDVVDLVQHQTGLKFLDVINLILQK